MRRYLIFAGETFYPKGGWRDYVGQSNGYAYATACAIHEYDKLGTNKAPSGAWAHVVDTETDTIVFKIGSVLGDD